MEHLHLTSTSSQSKFGIRKPSQDHDLCVVTYSQGQASLPTPVPYRHPGASANCSSHRLEVFPTHNTRSRTIFDIRPAVTSSIARSSGHPRAAGHSQCSHTMGFKNLRVTASRDMRASASARRRAGHQTADGAGGRAGTLHPPSRGHPIPHGRRPAKPGGNQGPADQRLAGGRPQTPGRRSNQTRHLPP